MAYEPKTWECGDVVTAEALNNIERGLAEASQGGGVEPYTVRVIGTSGANCELRVQDPASTDTISVGEITEMLKSGRNVGFVIADGTYAGTYGAFLLENISSRVSGYALHMRQNGDTTASLTALFLRVSGATSTTGLLLAHDVA